MKDKRSLHLKVQELCDCYATTDPLKEMSIVRDDKDKEEAGLKWLALAALHGINANAKKIAFTRSKDGSAKVSAEYRKSELPSPGPEVGDKIIEAVRAITHLEGEKAKSALALGIRESSIEVNIKVKRAEDGEKVSLEFPE
jgi:hypothetical protein